MRGGGSPATPLSSSTRALPTMMKLAYGTYGMPEVPVWDALPRLAEMGYDAVEICVAERWPTAPRKLAAPERQRLRGLLEGLRLEMPAVMLFVNLLAPA